MCRDDSRLDTLERCLGFFAPELTIFKLPAWDCLPYDRVSPNGEIVSQRLEALARLSEAGEDDDFILLTTVNAVLQRLPPRAFFEGSSLTLKVGASHPIDTLLAFLASNGYGRTGTVRESGEYAVRGGIIDVFPSGDSDPLRLDFFGDELEGIRNFDPVSQRTVGKIKKARLRPVAEVLLDEAGVQRFRSGYRSNFGTDVLNDPLYTSITEGRRHTGMEHWLPLFHESMETIFEHAPDAVISFDNQADSVAATRFELITEYFDARRSLHERGTEDGGSVYRPLPPELLYLGQAEWRARIASCPAFHLFPFDIPDVAAASDVQNMVGGAGPGVSFAEARTREGANLYNVVGEAVVEAQKAGTRVILSGYSNGSRDRLVGLLRDHGIELIDTVDTYADVAALPAGTIAAVTLPIERGFLADGALVITEPDILGERLARPSRRRRRRGEEFLQEVSALSEGDYVVHAEHGIGQYKALETLAIGGAPHDCLRLVYSGGDKLFLPVENIDMLSRYGSEETNAVLDKLGGVAWQARKSRVKKRLRDMADQLIRIAAEREIRTTESITPPPGVYDEFCAKFPYNETDDQLRAIDEVLVDVARGRPMDRLICGDVGFGKTEVALRAAMVVAMQGFQVAVVAPTTLLCRQHYHVFKERFADLPVTIRQLSRLVGAAETNETKKDLKVGDCSIVIGTHAVLSKSVDFDNLGLLIVDEEQHFGVSQKERLKDLRAEIHVLTLTATPIPRTLQLALSGVRDLSLIATPPVDRLSIRTFVMPYDGMVIREAIQRERNRGGQTFYV
ncbi:MAG: DEAD/DEAH box helicase, partial [Alphaproteobacteria bacterium]|nr:DEAD/DEAH box helicase [Alphaproteobacteria bacterium]